MPSTGQAEPGSKAPVSPGIGTPLLTSVATGWTAVGAWIVVVIVLAEKSLGA